MMIDFTEFKKIDRKRPSGEIPPCPEKVLAEHVAGGRQHEVFLENPHIIGRGHFAVVFAVLARVVGIVPRPHDPSTSSDEESVRPFADRRRGYEFPAVIKKFYNGRNALTAFSLYDVCKDAGLRVPTTYRIDQREGVVLMTDLGGDDAYAISGNNWSIGVDALIKNNLHGIANWDDVLMRLFTAPLTHDSNGHVVAGSEVSRATACNIELQPDVYFFKLPKHTDTPALEPIAADFDIVQHPSKRQGHNLLKYNVVALGTTCKLFIETYVQPEAQQVYLDALYVTCQRATSSNG